MKLSFFQNEFVLQRSENEFINFHDHDWFTKDNLVFVTKDIKGAARFRKFADERAERIFKKLMLVSHSLPTGGIPSPPEGLEYYPFQVERGIPHILSSNRSYLAHQPGLGKSAQGIGAVNAKPGRCLIICPSFLKITWAREITKWFAKDFPSIAILPESTKKHKMNWDADFVIASDSMIAKEWVMDGLNKQKFRYTYVDEVHRFKEPSAHRTTALFGGLSGKVRSKGLIYNSEHVSVFSGTPLLSRPIELWPVLYSMAPELIDFLPYQDFGMRYGGAILDDRGHWRFVGSANEADLNRRIMGRFMQRITKKDVLHELPAKIREAVIVDVDTRAQDVVALDKELQKKLRRTQFETPKALGDFARLAHENGLAKVKWASNFVMNYLVYDLSEQILLFAWHRDVVAALAKELSIFNPMVINGGVSLDKRTRIEDLFQSKKRRLIIGNIQAMNLGLTLTAATRVVFAEYGWTPSENEQAEDRAHRIGQLDNVYCQYLVYPNSIDEMKLNSLLTKETRIEKVLKT